MFLMQREAPNDPSSIAYFMGCVSQGKGIVIDAHLDDIDWFMENAKDKGVAISAVIDTHIHADHLSAGRTLSALTGADYLLHESAETEFKFTPLKHNQLIRAGNVEVKILHTPGHTLDSICLLVTDHSRSPHPWFLLSQHTLFVGSVGRPDLKGREIEMAGLLYDSLHNQLLSLPNHIEILPGAKAGSVCGAGISAKPVSTIGFEILSNSILSLSKADFISEVIINLPPQPDNMIQFLQINQSI